MAYKDYKSRKFTKAPDKTLTAHVGRTIRKNHGSGSGTRKQGPKPNYDQQVKNRGKRLPPLKHTPAEPLQGRTVITDPVTGNRSNASNSSGYKPENPAKIEKYGTSTKATYTKTVGGDTIKVGSAADMLKQRKMIEAEKAAKAKEIADRRALSKKGLDARAAKGAPPPPGAAAADVPSLTQAQQNRITQIKAEIARLNAETTNLSKSKAQVTEFAPAGQHSEAETKRQSAINKQKNVLNSEMDTLRANPEKMSANQSRAQSVEVGDKSVSKGQVEDGIKGAVDKAKGVAGKTRQFGPKAAKGIKRAAADFNKGMDGKPAASHMDSGTNGRTRNWTRINTSPEKVGEAIRKAGSIGGKTVEKGVQGKEGVGKVKEKIGGVKGWAGEKLANGWEYASNPKQTLKKAAVGAAKGVTKPLGIGAKYLTAATLPGQIGLLNQTIAEKGLAGTADAMGDAVSNYAGDVIDEGRENGAGNAALKVGGDVIDASIHGMKDFAPEAGMFLNNALKGGLDLADKGLGAMGVDSNLGDFTQLRQQGSGWDYKKYHGGSTAERAAFNQRTEAHYDAMMKAKQGGADMKEWFAQHPEPVMGVANPDIQHRTADTTDPAHDQNIANVQNSRAAFEADLAKREEALRKLHANGGKAPAGVQEKLNADRNSLSEGPGPGWDGAGGAYNGPGGSHMISEGAPPTRESMAEWSNRRNPNGRQMTPEMMNGSGGGTMNVMSHPGSDGTIAGNVAFYDRQRKALESLREKRSSMGGRGLENVGGTFNTPAEEAAHVGYDERLALRNAAMGGKLGQAAAMQAASFKEARKAKLDQIKRDTTAGAKGGASAATQLGMMRLQNQMDQNRIDNQRKDAEFGIKLDEHQSGKANKSQEDNAVMFSDHPDDKQARYAATSAMAARIQNGKGSLQDHVAMGRKIDETFAKSNVFEKFHEWVTGQGYKSFDGQPFSRKALLDQKMSYEQWLPIISSFAPTVGGMEAIFDDSPEGNMLKGFLMQQGGLR